MLAATAVLVGVGFYVGWFTLTTEHHERSFTASFTVRTDLMKDAEEKAEQKARNIEENVREHVTAPKGTRTVNGTITLIEESTQFLTVKTADDQAMTFHLEPSSKITVGGLRGLQVGDRVTVVYYLHEGKNLVRSITVERALQAAS